MNASKHKRSTRIERNKRHKQKQRTNNTVTVNTRTRTRTRKRQHDDGIADVRNVKTLSNCLFALSLVIDEQYK
jgi:hypothetical protein